MDKEAKRISQVNRKFVEETSNDIDVSKFVSKYEGDKNLKSPNDILNESFRTRTTIFNEWYLADEVDDFLDATAFTVYRLSVTLMRYATIMKKHGIDTEENVDDTMDFVNEIKNLSKKADRINEKLNNKKSD
jgi:hypothetical protein